MTIQLTEQDIKNIQMFYAACVLLDEQQAALLRTSEGFAEHLNNTEQLSLLASFVNVKANGDKYAIAEIGLCAIDHIKSDKLVFNSLLIWMSTRDVFADIVFCKHLPIVEGFVESIRIDTSLKTDIFSTNIFK